MSAVYKKELKGYFTNMTGFIFIAFILIVSGIFVTAYNLKSGYPNFEYALSDILFIFLLAVPILTMLSFAEEKRQKTDKLLYSLPLTNGGIVVGKFLAMLTVFAISVLLLAMIPLILNLYGSVNFLSAYGALIGFFFLGAALLSIGMFISTMTESTLISAVISFGVMLAIYLLNSLASLIPTTAAASFLCFLILGAILAFVVYVMTKSRVAAIITLIVAEAAVIGLYIANSTLFASLFPNLLNKISIFDRFTGFVNGLFDITTIIYYASVITVFLFLSAQSLEKRRWN